MPFLQEGYGCFPLPSKISQGSVLEPPGADACCEFYSPACAPYPGAGEMLQAGGAEEEQQGLSQRSVAF